MAKKRRNLHICTSSPIIPPFVRFIGANFTDSKHFFYVVGNSKGTELPKGENIMYCNGVLPDLGLIVRMYRYDRVVLHGLFDIRVVVLLYCNPWLLKKCYWVLWGGDYFCYRSRRKNIRWRIREHFRRPVIRNIGHLITYIDASVQLVRNWYGACGVYHECIAYPSNTVQEKVNGYSDDGKIDVLVGNSADPSNEHLSIFEKLKNVENNNIRIYVPLSYGDKVYAREVADLGREIFGGKFTPLFDLMSVGEYFEFLGRIDVAMFNHNRHQGMGNIINLLGMGKMVYIRSDIGSWDMLRSKGIKVFDIASFRGFEHVYHVEENVERVRRYFAKATLRDQWAAIFHG